MFKSGISKQKSQSSKNLDLSNGETKNDGKDFENAKTNNLKKLQNKADSSSKVNSLNTIELKQSKSNNSVIQLKPDLEEVASMDGISSNLKNASRNINERVNHGEASMLGGASNTLKNTITDATSTGKSVYSTAKKKVGKALGEDESANTGRKIVEHKGRKYKLPPASKKKGFFSRAKSFFGSLFKGKGKGKGKGKKNDKTKWEKAKGAGAAGLNVLKGAGVGAVSEVAKKTVGSVADIGIETVRGAKSGYNAREALQIAKGRDQNDLLAATAKDVSKTHAKQALGSLANAGKTAGSIASSVATHGIKDAATAKIKGAVEFGATMGGVGTLSGPGEQKAIESRSDLNIKESLDGKSEFERINEKGYDNIINKGGTGELSEEQIKAASKFKSNLIHEGLDRGAGYKSRTEANRLTNKANSIGTSDLKDKSDLKDEAVKKREEAQEHRDAVNEGTETLKPSDFKARTGHLKKLKGIGDQWKADDPKAYRELIASEQKTRERTPLATELINKKRDELMGKKKSRDETAQEVVKQQSGKTKFRVGGAVPPKAVPSEDNPKWIKRDNKWVQAHDEDA